MDAEDPTCTDVGREKILIKMNRKMCAMARCLRNVYRRSDVLNARGRSRGKLIMEPTASHSANAAVSQSMSGDDIIHPIIIIDKDQPSVLDL